MIQFERGDFNLEAIKSDSGLGRVATTEDFRVYGLRNGHGNPPVLITHPQNAEHQQDIDFAIANVEKFFATLGIELEKETYQNGRGDDGTDYRVHIGVRRDIRENIPLASAVLKTIVYALEGIVLELDPAEVGFTRVKKLQLKTED